MIEELVTMQFLMKMRTSGSINVFACFRKATDASQNHLKMFSKGERGVQSTNPRSQTASIFGLSNVTSTSLHASRNNSFEYGHHVDPSSLPTQIQHGLRPAEPPATVPFQPSNWSLWSLKRWFGNGDLVLPPPSTEDEA